MNNKKLFLVATPLLLLCFCFACCKKHVAKTELEKLPPITQIGANTFGCILNGAAYTPGGGGLLDRVMVIHYDPTFQGGRFSIKTQRISSSDNYLSLSIHADGIRDTGTYQLVQKGQYWVYYDDLKNNNCSFETISYSPTSGLLTVTKFDTASRIVSGTFSFKISTIACGLINVTNGRFDVKY